MRIAILTTAYQDLISRYYKTHPDAAELPFEPQQEQFVRMTSLWAGGWERALIRKGWTARTFTINNILLQRTWAREHSPSTGGLNDIAIGQLRHFRPDIVWYDHADQYLLKRLKEDLPSVRYIIGWTGSFVVDPSILKQMDLVFSCAPEIVELYGKEGLPVYQLHHAFDPEHLNYLQPPHEKEGLVFAGQIVRGGESHHARREALLKHMAEAVDIDLYSSSHDFGMKEILSLPLKQAVYIMMSPFRGVPSVMRAFQSNRFLKKLADLNYFPRFPYDPALKKKLRPPLYGIDMLQRYRDAQAVLNIHADSSPRYASNMRLFEATGVGTCLLTERRANIQDLFADESEVVTYDNPGECIEKAQWLLSHPAQCNEIAQQGQRRTLRDHTFDKRAGQFMELIGKKLLQ